MILKCINKTSSKTFKNICYESAIIHAQLSRTIKVNLACNIGDC